MTVQRIQNKLWPLLLLFASCRLEAQDASPIDKEATAETVHLYKNLRKSLNKAVLFGHQDDPAYGVGWKYVPGKSDVKAVTGEYPAVYGWELGCIGIDHPVNLDSVPFDKMRAFIREGYERGGIITISWHLNNPLTGKTAWDPAPGTVASILPGGEKQALYKSWLDRIAAFMLSLKGKHGEYIPVIFRPFHEINGNWFWWGGKNCTPNEIKELWRFTVSYLRDIKQVHNLLYAYNTDRFTSKEDFLERYPGDQWVDITGFDSYQVDGNSEAFGRSLDQTLSMLDSIARERNKIPALTEFGYNGLADSTWWTGTLLKALGAHRIAYALAWRNAGYKPSSGHYEFYVPYPGQSSAGDFRRFCQAGKIFLQQAAAKENLYQ